MVKIKNNDDFRQHSAIFHYAATTITIVDIIYILILCPLVEYPLLTIFLIALFPLMNVPTIKLSEKKNKNYMYYSLILTLIPLFFIGFLSGSEMPGWFPAFSLITAVEMFFLNTTLKHLMHIVIIFVVGLAQYLVGTEFFDNIIILSTLIIVILLTSSIFSFINKRLQEIEAAKRKIDELHKNTRDSIEYAALIQNALIPENQIINSYCKDNFAFWQPKDIVGGDIYFITELQSKEEVLIMVIDGAGHGVPGAFVTMLVKAIETQITADITSGVLDPSPAKILEYFNKSIKTMLNQEKGSKSNAGFDGGVLYYNKKTNECKYAGAKTDLYIINNQSFEVINSDRKNVGFVRTKIDQKYTEHTVAIKDGTKLYLSTDGFYDQEGENNERYGKKEFERMLLKTSIKSMDKQKDEIIDIFKEYKKDFEQSDDVTVMGLEF